MHSLLILSRLARDYHALVDAAHLPELSIVSTADPAEAAARAASCDLAFGEPALLRQVMPTLTAVRWIQSTWAGVEPLLDPALRRDYILTNARGVFGAQMSEYVFAYLLAHERKIFEKQASQEAGRWDPTPPSRLRGKTLGLLGVGTIGAALAATAKHFGMRVKGYTRASEESADVDEYFHGALADCAAALGSDLDYLVSVMPDTAATHHLIGDALLRALPPRAIFVNPGRGGVVDERALAAALQEGRLAGAVLDVFEREPLPADHVFWRLPTVHLTAHTAALSVPADIAPLFVDNYRRLQRGEPLRYRVDFERGY
jgi:phosphoglycerate dehydrogenase-like enzyme